MPREHQAGGGGRLVLVRVVTAVPAVPAVPVIIRGDDASSGRGRRPALWCSMEADVLAASQLQRTRRMASLWRARAI